MEPCGLRRFDRCRQTQYGSTVLFCRSLRHRENRYEDAAFGFGTELDATVDQREQRVILAKPTFGPGCHLVPRWRAIMLPASTCSPPNIFRPSRWPVGVAAVAGRSACFFVSHRLKSLLARYVIQLRDEIITSSCIVARFRLARLLGRGLRGFLRGFGLRLSPSAAFLSAGSVASGAAVLAAAVSPRALAGPLVGLAPSVRISVMRIRVNSCRWPRFRREFLRRRFLKAMTLAPRPCSSISAATLAPATVGRAERDAVAAHHQNLAELHDLAGLALDPLDLEHCPRRQPGIACRRF